MSLIAPSILNSDFLNLGESIEMINQSEAEWIHLDVMDGSFVPNISFGIPVVQAARRITQKPLDVHLMIVNPEKYIKPFRDAGADIINIHYEACKDKNIVSFFENIRKEGARPAMAINPDTPISKITQYCKHVDMILVMSVFPGFGGQKFIEATYDRVKELKSYIKANSLDTLIHVDGGVSKSNASKLKECGVDVMVVGSVIFNAETPIKTISELKSLV